MIVLDTNVVSEILKKDKSDHNVINWFIQLPPQECRTTTVTVAELLYGLALKPAGWKRDALSQTIQAFIATYRNRTWSFNQTAATHYAAIAASRRQAGRPIGVQDAMIAAIARSHGATVATRNIKDFEGTGVELINPWEYAQ